MSIRNRGCRELRVRFPLPGMSLFSAHLVPADGLRALNGERRGRVADRRLAQEERRSCARTRAGLRLGRGIGRVTDVKTRAIVYAAISVCAVALSGCMSIPRQYDVALTREAAAAEKPARLGEYDKAIGLLEKAMAGYTVSSNDLGVLYCMERMGWLLRERGRYGASLEMLQKALPLGVKLHGDAAEIDADIGDVHMFTGDHERAKRHYEQTLATLKGYKFPTSFSRPPTKAMIADMVRRTKATVHARINMGTLLFFAGKHDEALQQLEAGRKMIDKVESVADHPFYGLFFSLPKDFWEAVGFCHTMTAVVLGEKGRYDEAWKSYDRGLKVFIRYDQRYGQLVNRGLRLKTRYRQNGGRSDATLATDSEAYLKEVKDFGAMDILWRAGFETGRAARAEKDSEMAFRVLQSAIEAIEMTRSGLREDSVKRVFAGSVQDVYAEMIGLCFDTGRMEEGFDYLERAKARAFLDSMTGRQVKVKAAVDPKLVAEADSLQDRLEVLSRVISRAEGSEVRELKEEYRMRAARRREVLEAIRNQSLAYAAATSVATVPARRIVERLPEKAALVSYFLESRRTLVWVVTRKGVTALRVDAGRDSLNDMVNDYREAIASRQDELCRTLAGKLGRLLVEPIAGHLQGMEVLYVVPSHSLQYLPVAGLPWQGDRMVVDAMATCSLPNASALFYGRGAVRPGMDAILAVGNPALEDKAMSLAFAEAEARGISSFFKRRTVWCGAEATETAVKGADMKGLDVVHLAVHGQYSTRSPLESALLLARDQRNDGRLEAFEIFAMDVGVPLVVLSACQSGTGTTSGGDEIQSLNRAFLYAGAGQVLATLWNVNDESTAVLMKAFYEAMPTDGPVRGLRNAQIRLRQRHAAPYYWAPFYLSGGSLP